MIPASLLSIFIAASIPLNQLLKGNSMGLFFNEPKQVKSEIVVIHKHGFWSVVVVILQTLFSVIGWVAERVLLGYFNVLKHLWVDNGSYDGKTLKARRVAAVALLALPCFFVYKIPYVRNLSLSDNQIVNLLRDVRIEFPDKQFFIETEGPTAFRLEENSSMVYISYSNEMDQRILRGEKGFCRLIPRGKKVAIKSDDRPIYAIGFEDTVSYKLQSDSWFFSKLDRYVPSFLDPSYKNNSWDTFYADWWSLESKGGARIPFIVKARNNENAMICF